MQLIDTGLIVTKRPAIIVPASIGRKMLSIYNLLANQSNEFGLYLRGAWEPERAGGPAVVVDPEAYYFPMQDVGPGHITFLEEPPDPGWNVVAHRHPPSFRSFSGVDDNSINREFLASFLYIPAWEFPDAIINIPVAVGVKVQVKADVAVDGDMLMEMGSLREPTKSRINPTEPSTAAPEAGVVEAALPLPGTLIQVDRPPAWPWGTGGAVSAAADGTLLGIPKNGSWEMVE